MCRHLFARVVAKAIGGAAGLGIHLLFSFGFSKQTDLLFLELMKWILGHFEAFSLDF
jgi:hypothetical protein